MTGTMKIILAGAEDMQQQAAKYTPPASIRGMINVELAMLTETVRTLGQVWVAFHSKATDTREGHPLPPPVMKALEALVTVQLKVAVAAEKIGPLATKLLKSELDEMEDQRYQMWDVRANGGNAPSLDARGSMNTLRLSAVELVKRAANYQKPEGIVELIDVEYTMMADVMKALTKVWVLLYMRLSDPAEGVKFPPAVMTSFDALSKVQDTMADAAERIPALAHRLVQDRLDELADPRQAMFDQTANRAA